MDQNEVTKHFKVGNTFLQATMHARTFCICYAMTWIRPMIKSRRNIKKRTKNNKISDGVNVLLVQWVYLLTEKPNNWKHTPVIGQ